MQREIKFRGKRVDGGGWVYGYYYKLGSQHFIRLDIFSWEVIPETVGQLITKVQRESRQLDEIFEDDLIVHGERVLRVAFMTGNTILVGEDKTTAILLSFNNGKVKAGNIHDTPQLLTK